MPPSRGNPGPYAEGATGPMRLNLDISRDLRRAALFLWMMPLPATRSSMLIASPTAVAATVGSPARIASSAFLTKVRAADRYGRLRCRRRSATKMRFFADLLFANPLHPSLNHQPSPDTPRPGARQTLPACYQTAGAGSTADPARPVSPGPGEAPLHIGA